MSKLKIEEWTGANAVEIYDGLKNEPYAIWFDSNRPSHQLNRWSFICWNPVETIEVKNGIIKHNKCVIGETDFFSFLQSRLNSYNFESDVDIPFIGGIAGYFGYDLGRQIEKLPDKTIDDIDVPDACVGIYTNIIAFDHTNEKAWKIGEDDLIEAPPSQPYAPIKLNWKSNKTEKEYCDDIQTTLDYIYAGEIYQANLSRRFTSNIPSDFDAFTHYKVLRDYNPAPYSAFMNFGAVKISSCSPEQFLSVRDNIVKTRPIKGTLPSSQPKEILLKSKKDIAENTMIVDLLRNDLSKVCDYHSVKVPELCALETFEGLHHLVSTVRGVLQKDKTAIDVLKACFPGGSITGAPKIRAMEIIEELEETRRGPYCGAIGYIGFDGTMDTSIIIRTLIYTNEKVFLQTGGGIVSDSKPQKELQETLDKAAKIFESFETIKNENVA